MATAIERYSRGAIVLHWALAILIVANLAIGLLHEDMPDDARRFWMGQHFAIGISVLVLTVVRLLWRLTHRTPELISTQARWERALAWAVHRLFYALMIVLPLLGWLTVSAGDGLTVSMFGLFDVAPLPWPESEAAGEAYGEAHELLAFAMIGLIVLHVAGALKHHLVDRDATLARMLPGRG